MKLSDFRDLTQGIQALVTVAGIIVAGAWAYFTFNALGSTQQASAQLTRTQEEVERDPRLEIALNPRVDRHRDVNLVVTLKNNGKLIAGVSDISVVIQKLGADGAIESGVASLRRQPTTLDARGQLADVQIRYLRSEQSRDLVFALPHMSPGRYIIQLSCKYSGFDETGAYELEPSSNTSFDAIQQAIMDVS